MASRAPLVSLALAGVLAAPAIAQDAPRGGPAPPATPGPAAQAAPAPLVIGLLPEVNLFAQRARFAPLGEYLGQRVGVPVRFTILPAYADVLERFRSGRMDGVFLGSFTGALAVDRLGLVPLARPVNADGTSTYHGYLFVRKDSGIHDVGTMRGKRMAFVDRATTAGYVFPVAWLRERGISSPGRYFGEVWFTGSHDGAVAAVLEGKADVGAAKNTVYDRLRAKEPRVDRELLILASSPPVPSNALCVRGDLDPALREALRRALLGLAADPEGGRALEAMGALRFVETSAADYGPVLQLARRAGIDPARWRPRD